MQPGDYIVLNPRKSIALAVLGGVDIDQPTIISALNADIAIIGSIATENLGVEHLVKNLVANPFLRHLVLWGEDAEGHLPGDALANLLNHGIDKNRRIIGARGARPVLRNITDAEVDHFRRQIQGVDLIGRKEIGDLTEQIGLLRRQSIQPYEDGLKVDSIEIEKARPAERLRLDPEGYFVIMVMTGKENPLLVEHYSNDGILENMIEGEDAASICASLIEKKLVSQLDHAAYLGRELARAELSLRMDTKYTQDRAQGDLV